MNNYRAALGRLHMLKLDGPGHEADNDAAAVRRAGTRCSAS